MMTIDTRDFGEKEIDESAVFDFPNGVFAFEDDRRFAILSPLGEDTYPMWLQSLDHKELCFIVFDPEKIDESFHITLNESEKRLLKVKEGDAVRCLTIAKIPEDFRQTTVNMKSPIVMNPATHTALQVILPHDYPFRYPLFPDEEVK